MNAMNEQTKTWTNSPDASTHQTPNLIPAAFQEVADKSIAQTKDTLVNAKAVTDKTANFVQHTYGAVFKSARDYNLKLIEITHFNTNSAFDYAQQLLRVRSPSELVELSSGRVRQLFETMTSQSKELSSVIQKGSNEIAEPLKKGIAGAFTKAA